MCLCPGIVIISLDGSESESDEPVIENSDVTISNALLDRLKKQGVSPAIKTPLPPSPSAECQALVLYRPINLGFAKQADESEAVQKNEPDELLDKNVVLSSVAEGTHYEDDDAMDVEP